MRELSFVKKLKFDFNGSVTKRAIVIGDADNDGRNELVCANLQGDLAIFKERDSNKFAYASELGMITACMIGDVVNLNRNFVVSINMEGWLFIFDVTQSMMRCAYTTAVGTKDSEIHHSETVMGEYLCDTYSGDNECDHQTNSNCDHPKKLNVFYEQRMPANCKEILLADLDGDGENELIIGLTDRVLRTYKWINIGNDRGKFVGLYKWEFADQIGSVSLNPSRHENCIDIIVAQPGGTYARLECFDKKPVFASTSSTSTCSGSSQNQNKKLSSNSTEQDDQKPHASNDSPIVDGEDNVKTEYISKLTPEYHQLAIAQMRNHHISTEVLGGLRNGERSNSYSSLVIATLDGTLMLVNKDEILWSLQVDHQLFALAVIEQTRKIDPQSTLPQSESTCTIVPSPECADQTLTSFDTSSTKTSSCNDGSLSLQYFVACAWDGKTYIVDEERNYLRFKFDEAVSAFTAGNYYFDGEHHSALVYATFNNQIVLYHDIVSDSIRPKFLLDEILNNPKYRTLSDKLKLLTEKLGFHGEDNISPNEDAYSQGLYNLVHNILYGLTDDELSSSN